MVRLRARLQPRSARRKSDVFPPLTTYHLSCPPWEARPALGSYPCTWQPHLNAVGRGDTAWEKWGGKPLLSRQVHFTCAQCEALCFVLAFPLLQLWQSGTTPSP